ncbi:MAG TPA: flagellin [Pseudomonas sp.]|nr:flagellin [Stutzerimonas xanthomarina]MBU0852130.1 flagellar protein FlaG [Gammaproteobacteria bacterium]HAQ86656.1 flagellin [Pseudomonas sp.]MBK3845854.1 flagellin [Stutzerimonas xanthomarina]MBK3846463.1 flagellin [Stutzerimonas xanthomarina]
MTAGSPPSLRKEAGFSASDTIQAVTSPAEAEAQQSTADLVEKFRSQMQNIQRDLSFSVDDSTGDVVVRVIDGESGKIVRQIPSEEILRLTERLDEMRSLLFEAKA